MPHPCRSRFAPALLALIAVAPAAAQAPRLTATVQQDNDYMGLSGADGDFTSGVRGEVLFHDVRGFEALRRALPFRPGCGAGAPCRTTVGYALGQLIYTPENISARRPVYTDRPYAGYLYGALVARRGDSTTLQSLEVQVGVTGEASLAGSIQRLVHRIGNYRRPRGWGNQLGERLGVNLGYDAQRRVAAGRLADVTARGGFAAGNIRTQLEVGGMARFGPRLGAAWPEGPQRPSGAVGFHVYLAGTARYKVYDYFLDGPGSAPYPDKLNEVLDLEAGMVVRVKCVQVGYRVVGRSPEYRLRHAWHRFGTATVSVGVGCRPR